MKRIFIVLSIITLALSAQAQTPGADKDWPRFGKYEEANKQITKAPNVVFMGDSITEIWYSFRPQFFTDNNYAGRGIGGQTTAHMLARFQNDVVDLHPQAVVILAGINDIARNNGIVKVENIFAMIKSMTQIAAANGIKPILCALVPCAQVNWRPDLSPAAEVAELNKLIKAYALDNGITFVDFFTPMAAPDGSLPKEISKDGCHPTAEGYVIMESIIKPVLDKIDSKEECADGTCGHDC